MTGGAREGSASPLVGSTCGAFAAFVFRDLGLFALFSYWDSRTLLVIGGAALGGLAWRTPLRRWLALAAAALVFLWVMVCATPLTSRLAAGLERHDQEAPADAVFVFASGLHRGGDLTGEALARLIHGFELLGEGRSSQLILSELPPPHASYSAAAARLMERMRIPGEIVTVGPIENTHDEAVAVANLARGKGWKKLLIVTSPMHTRRAAAALESQGLEILASPSMETRFDWHRLDQWDDRTSAFGAVLHERVGLWVYALRGWIADRPGGPAKS